MLGLLIRFYLIAASLIVEAFDSFCSLFYLFGILNRLGVCFGVGFESVRSRFTWNWSRGFGIAELLSSTSILDLGTTLDTHTRWQ